MMLNQTSEFRQILVLLIIILLLILVILLTGTFVPAIEFNPIQIAAVCI